MKNLIITILALLVFSLTAYCVRLHGRRDEVKPLLIERIIEIQEEVGARPDGVIGPESTGLINAQTKEELPEYCNRQAVASMERMAGKE